MSEWLSPGSGLLAEGSGAEFLPDWLVPTSGSDDVLTIRLLFTRMVVSLVCGVCVAVIYRISHGRRQGNSAPLMSTLVLLSGLIAMVSMVIGNSVARAFSLVGALSIVRFRTVVEDTRDTAFVIFAVIAGMAAGAGLNVVPLVGIPLVGLAAVVMNTMFGGSIGGARAQLKLRLNLGREPKEILEGVFGKHLRSYQMVGATTVKQGAAMEVQYRVRLNSEEGMVGFVNELNRVEGVQSVEVLPAE